MDDIFSSSAITETTATVSHLASAQLNNAVKNSSKHDIQLIKACIKVLRMAIATSYGLNEMAGSLASVLAGDLARMLEYGNTVPALEDESGSLFTCEFLSSKDFQRIPKTDF